MRKNTLKWTFLFVLLLTTNLIQAQKTLPYSFDFSNASAFTEDWTVIDQNNDGKKWERASTNDAKYGYDSKNIANDWLISPGVNLLAGKGYKLSFKVKTASNSFAENLKVTLGNNKSVDAQENVLLDIANLKNSVYTLKEITFSVPENSVFYVGFQCYSKANMMGVLIDDFKLEEILPYPAQITDLAAQAAPNGTLSATLTWTNPSKDQTGNNLSSMTQVKVYRNNTIIATLDNQEVGKSVTWEDQAIPAAGKYDYKVVAVNENGDALGTPQVVKSPWIGADIPVTVSDLTATAGENSIQILFTAPTQGKNGGWIDVSTLGYQIKRNPGQILLEENYTGNLPYTDSNIPEIGAYSYIVTAQTKDGVGEPVTSNKAICGNAKLIPYSTTFDTTDDFDIFTVIDSNMDNKKWIYKDKNVQYSGGSTADDWLITPPLVLQAGKSYQVSFKTKVYSYSNPKNIKVTLGKNATVGAQTTELGTFKVDYALFQGQQISFFVPESGDWNIGFQCFGTSSPMEISLDDISVKEIPTFPGIATNLSTSVAENGQLSCLVNWNNPAIAESGSPIGSLKDIELFRGDEMIYSKENPIPGDNESFTDNTITEAGKYTYRIIASTVDGAGKPITIESGWVGPDIPEKVSDLTLTNENGKPKITFSATKEGINNGWLDMSNLAYRIERNPGKVVLDEMHTDTFYIDTDVLPLASYSYIVTAIAGEKKSEAVVSNSMAFGESLQLPYVMNFMPSEDFGIWAIVDNNKDSKTWTYNAKSSQVEYTSYSIPDDWLFTPPFQATSGLHTLIFSIKTNGRYPEQMRVTLGKTTNPSEHQILDDFPNIMSGLFKKDSVVFEIPEEGKWYIGLQLYSNNPWGAYINNVTIKSNTLVDITNTENKNNYLFYNQDNQSLILPEPEKINRITVINAGGACVYSMMNPSSTIGLENLPGGIYFVRFETKDNTGLMKFVK